MLHSCRADQIHRQGVAIILEEKLAKQLADYDLINERIMIIQLKMVQEPLFVFQVYAPDSSYGQDLKDEFYSLLQQRINKPPRKSGKIIIADFNGKVGTNGIDMYPDNCGKYGVETMNDEGERLLKFCAINNFAVMNMVYKKTTKKQISNLNISRWENKKSN